jgi:hypothetical protein
MDKIAKAAKLAISLTLCFVACNATAQWYVGITGDLGSRVRSTPAPPYGLLKNPATISTSIMLLKTIHVQSSWRLQFGVAAGTMGYIVKSAPYDTVPRAYANTRYHPIRNYNTFYFNGLAAFGKHLQLNSVRYLEVFLGGGITYYIGPNNQGGVKKYPSQEYLFEYEMHRKNEKVKGFVDVFVQTNLTRRLVLGLRYRHHFTPALEGTYNYPHAKASGQLSVTQRAVSVVFLARISGGKNL